MSSFPEADVSVEDHAVIIRMKGSLKQEVVLKEEIRAIAMATAGVRDVHVDIIPLV